MNQETLNRLAQAAAEKGRPLTDHERHLVITNAGRGRDYWRERFINVIRLAGYKGDAPERICDEWLDTYLADLPKFEAMLENYERNNGDPD